MTNQETPLAYYSTLPYADQFELVQDMASARYKSSPAFRDCVAAKVALSTGIGTDDTKNLTPPGLMTLETGAITAAENASEAAQQQRMIDTVERLTNARSAEEQAAEERALAALTAQPSVTIRNR